jgi:hypothetical protein
MLNVGGSLSLLEPFMKRYLPYLILFTALSVSLSAAFYSVFGLSKLFAGASLQVIIMASSLELAKVVIATLLHTYWREMNRLLRTYLTVATVVLVVITSAGIYGYLSSAYQITANLDAQTSKQIEIIRYKKDEYVKQLDELKKEKDGIVTSITQLRGNLSTVNQTQYIDRKTGQVITNTSTGGKKAVEGQLQDAIKRRDAVDLKITERTDSVLALESRILQVESSSSAASELGPLKYLSGLTGRPMDEIVNYFLLLLIAVFDPLAVSLILAANFAFQIRQATRPVEALNLPSDEGSPTEPVDEPTQPDTEPLEAKEEVEEPAKEVPEWYGGSADSPTIMLDKTASEHVDKQPSIRSSIYHEYETVNERSTPTEKPAVTELPATFLPVDQPQTVSVEAGRPALTSEETERLKDWLSMVLGLQGRTELPAQAEPTPAGRQLTIFDMVNDLPTVQPAEVEEIEVVEAEVLEEEQKEYRVVVPRPRKTAATAAPAPKKEKKVKVDGRRRTITEKTLPDDISQHIRESLPWMLSEKKNAEADTPTTPSDDAPRDTGMGAEK